MTYFELILQEKVYILNTAVADKNMFLLK